MSVESSESTQPHRSGHLAILAGLAIGVAAGLVAQLAVQRGGQAAADVVQQTIAVAEPIGKLFLRTMQMVVLPLVFSALVLAVLEVGDVRQLGRMGLATLGCTGLLSISAVAIGILLVNAIRPGAAITEEQRQTLQSAYGGDAAKNVDRASQAKSLGQTLVDLLPENPVQEMAGAVDGSSKGNGMLAVMVFALLTGIACTLNRGEAGALIETLKGVNAVSMTIIGWALAWAPLGAGCLVYCVTARLGPEFLLILFWFVATVIAGLILHVAVTYSTVLTVFARRSPWRFLQDVSEAAFVAFSTSSSSATLSTSIKVAQEDLKLSPAVSNFVLTVGATGNQNGTALFEGVVVLFLAQVFGVHLSIGQQFTVVLMSVLAGVGTAGIPGGSIPLIVVVLRSVGIPGEGVAIILGVDRLLDMCRTTVNVTGDMLTATIVGTSEGAINPPADTDAE